MENEDDILSALQKGVTAAVAQSDNPSLPVKYLLKSFSIPNNQEWLEIVWIPNNRRGDFLGQEKNHRGIEPTHFLGGYRVGAPLGVE